MVPSQLTPRPASLSRDLNSTASLPPLAHSLHDPNSVLSLSADADHIFTGSQCFDISVSNFRNSCRKPSEKYLKVWEKKTFTYRTGLVGHTGSILALEYAEDKKWLFSSSGTYRPSAVRPQG